MAVAYGDNIDLKQNQLLNALFQVLSAPPGTPLPGQVYYNSTLKTALQWSGSAWLPFDATQASGIPISALAVNPLARANQTGTQPSSTISDLAAVVQAYPLSAFAAPTANVPFAAKNITGLADPVNPQDGATKNYVDNSVQAAAAGIESKPPVAAVSVANQALSGLPTIDGVALPAGSRVLLTAQTTTSQNGPWLVSSGAWARPGGDASPNNELTLGALWYVEQGAAYGGSQFILASPTSGAITPGTTSVAINQFNGSANLTFGNGLQKVGSVVSTEVVAAGGVLAGTGGLQVDTTVVARKYATTIGDGSTLTYTITHNLGTLDVLVSIRLISTGEQVITDNLAVSLNTVSVSFASAPASNTYRVIVLG
jgi:hypothetical protein